MPAGRKEKRPKVKEDVSNQKKPRAVSDPAQNNYNLSWHISLLEMVDPFGWHILDANKLLELRDKLGQFENKNWNEVLVREKDHNHSVSVESLCKAAQDRLMEIGQDDIDDLVSLRLTGKERVWGIRHQHILKLLWWDPDHQVCPSKKKHT